MSVERKGWIRARYPNEDREYAPDDRYSHLYYEYEAIRLEQDTTSHAGFRDIPENVVDFMQRQDKVLTAARAGLREFPTDSFFVITFEHDVILMASYIVSVVNAGQWHHPEFTSQDREKMVSLVNEALSAVERYYLHWNRRDEPGYQLSIKQLNGYLATFKGLSWKKDE